MRRALLAVLLLCAATVGAQDFIRYYPPTSTLTAGGSSFFSGGISLGNTVDSPYSNLYGDAANALALRNGASAQTFNIYGSYTSASVYQRGFLDMSVNANFLTIGTVSAGGGTAAGLAFRVNGTNTLLIDSGRNYLAPSSSDAMSLGNTAFQFQNLYSSRSIQGSKTKALTEAAPTTVATVAVPQTAGSNFAAGEVRYTVYASDGTDTQALNGSAFFSAVNKAGTEACQITDDQIGTEAASTGTLVCTVACAVGLTDVVGITFDCTSSLTQSTLNALVRFDMQQLNTLVFP